MKSRILTREERRLVIDALVLAGRAARQAKAEALTGPATPAIRAHVDELARRSGTLDRLAAELGSYDLRLEKPES